MWANKTNCTSIYAGLMVTKASRHKKIESLEGPLVSVLTESFTGMLEMVVHRLSELAPESRGIHATYDQLCEWSQFESEC